jgi:hypothetical protein
MGKSNGVKVAVFIFLAGLTSGAAFLQQVGSGMVGFWRLEETASPSADSSGNNNTSQAWSAGVTSLPGPANTPPALGANSTACLSFNGTSGVVTIPSTPELTITGDLTIALWVYKNSEAADWVRLVGKGTTTVRTYGVWEENGAGARILFQMYDGNNAAVLSYYSNGTIPLNQWTHVACRMSGTAATIFINGSPSGTGTRNGTPGSSADPVTLGYGGFHTYWPGRLDDVRIYDRALSNADILDLAMGNQGPLAPTNLTATGTPTDVGLTWTASGATTYNVKRATTAGGPYTTIASSLTGTTYTDTTVSPGTIYYYVVSGVTYGEGPNSNEASALPGLITVFPYSGLFTSEAGVSTVTQISLVQALPAGQSVTFTVTSSDAAEGVVSSSGKGPAGTITFTIDGPQPALTKIPLTITGVDDPVVDGNAPYTVQITTTGYYGAVTIPNLQCTNNDNDVAGITFTRTSGVTTTESGGADTFTVVLNTRPTSAVTMNLTSSNVLEGLVSPSTLTFTTTGAQSYSTSTGIGGWNVGHDVTVTGVDDSVLDFTVPYTITTSALSSTDPSYGGMSAPDVACVNLDNEVPPTLPPVWGGGSCGLLGVEALLAAFALRLLRRRRRDREPTLSAPA